MKSHAAGRVYLAIVDGNIREDFGTVNAPIGRHPVDRKRMAVVPNGREAITHWHVLERYGTYTLIAVRLETGRTHQIRVHMAYCKHPVSGDAVYGGEKTGLAWKGKLCMPCVCCWPIRALESRWRLKRRCRNISPQRCAGRAVMRHSRLR